MSLSPTLSPTLSASPSLGSLPKTTIIINNLKKNDFIIEGRQSLSLVDRIKLNICGLKPADVPKEDQENYFTNRIQYWSNLPFLNRTIIILKDEDSASKLYAYLTSKSASDNIIAQFPYIKVTLQENLLSRSNSFDSLIRAPESVNASSGEKFREPEPQPFDETDLTKLNYDVTSNDQEQLNKDDGVKRSRSLTKTLFTPKPKPKPSLSVNIPSEDLKPHPDFPQSPTITLDETF